MNNPDDFEGDILAEGRVPDDPGHDGHDLCQVVFNRNDAAPKLSKESRH